MNEEYVDWKGRALAAEAETLNLKNLCAHHGICTACGEYYSHHYIEPFATCNCNTSEWYELTEYMKLQDELRKLREQEPIKYLYRVTDCFGHDVLRDDPKGATILETIPLYAAPVHAPAVLAVPDGDDFNGSTPHLIQCMEALVRLDADGVLVPHGIGRDASKLLSAAANRLRKQPAPSVPEEWREFVKRTAEVGLHATNSGVECTCYRCVAIRGARALLQSPAVKESLTTQADCRALNNNRSKTT